jgi:hypothetical protein
LLLLFGEEKIAPLGEEKEGPLGRGDISWQRRMTLSSKKEIKKRNPNQGIPFISYISSDHINP